MVKRIGFMLACVLLVVPASAFAIPIVPIVTAGSDTVNVGDTFSIPISITAAVELTSWQFDLSFDATILSASAVTEGPFLSESGTKTTLFTPGVIDNSTGQITLVADSFVDLPPGPSGSGVLADIEFQALSPGMSSLTLSNVFLNLSDSGFETGNGLVTVRGPGVAVPEPGTLVLVTVGLGAWVVRRSRRSRASARQRALYTPLEPRLVDHQQGGKPMKTLLVTLVTIVSLALAAGPIEATTSAGPYYATPAWDQQLECSTTTTCPRFIVLSNWVDATHQSGGAAVLDRETGLVWEQSPSTTPEPWESAQVSCNTKNVGNRKGWRLPTVQELASLVDPTQSIPALPAGHPFSNVQSSFYWSATTFASFTSFAWVVFFNFGGVGSDVKSNTHFVWCVRGGHGVDPQ